MRSFLRRLALTATFLVALTAVFASSALATNGRVLILDSTVSGGAGSREAQAATAASRGVDVVSAATWGTMTTAQFAAYDALILGDRTCTGVGAAAAAQANAPVWAAAVTGNVLINGTDPVYHHFQGGSSLTNGGVSFAVASAPAKTGAYISLSCYYHGTANFTPVPLLSGFGVFTMRGVGCYNNAHIVASHPALTGMTDATLSNWSCSVHEAFDSWPLSFEVLAIARGIGAIYTAPDGSDGTPYIIARGVTVISDIDLSPATATNPIGTTHTVTANVAEDGTPRGGVLVTFKVISGPNTGTTGTGITDGAGNASFTYTGSGGPGTDIIEATFVDSLGRTQRSNRVEKIWEAPRIADLAVTKVDLADPIKNGDSVTYKIEVLNNGPAAAMNAQLNDTLSGPGTISAVTTDTGSCTSTPTTVSCSLGNLASGALATINVTVASNDDGTLSDTATASSDNPDDNAANNSATAETTVTPVAAVSVTKTGPASIALGSGNVTYTITVSNAGPDPADNVLVSDVLTGPGTITGASAPCTFTASTATCSLGTLAVGGSTTVTITVTPTTIGTLNDKAHADTSTFEYDKSNNDAEASTRVVDTTKPSAACVEAPNPSGKNVPTAGANPKSGQNPDGFYYLRFSDNVAVASAVVEMGSFTSDPFSNGAWVKITQTPGGAGSDTRPGPGGITAHLKGPGDAVLIVTDSSGNVTRVSCLVPPPPK